MTYGPAFVLDAGETVMAAKALDRWQPHLADLDDEWLNRARRVVDLGIVRLQAQRRAILAEQQRRNDG